MFRALLGSLDPRLVEARVRLGRVLTLLDRPGDARRELDTALSATRDPLLRYYAELFNGRAAEAVGDWPRARRSYDEAVSLYPRAQSPRLALSQIAHMSAVGFTSARDGLLALAVDGDERDDPWWTYHTGAGRDHDALFDRLLAMLLAGDRR